MTIEFIQKRIEGKEKEIAKLTKKLARIRKVEATGWDDDHNPYLYNEDDLRHCLKDLEAAQNGLTEWQGKMTAETEKANSRDVKVILDFLEMWKDQVREYYGNALESFFTDLRIVRAAHARENSFTYGSPDWQEAHDEADRLQKQFSVDKYGKYEKQMVFNPWRNKEESVDVKVSTGKYEFLKGYMDGNLTEAMAKLNKDLNEEANRKYDFIIERTNAIVGQITDASGLFIGDKQDLNGFIIGTKGTAKVQTIGAGGYNIQCFHFRTLINKW